MDLATGAVQVVSDLAAYGVPAWNADGTIVFGRNVQPFELAQVPATGGEVRRATTLTPGTPRATPSPPTAGGYSPAFDTSPVFLPDGRRFIFFNVSAEGGLYVASLDGGGERRLVAGASEARFVRPHWLLYVRNATLVAHRMNLADATLSGDPIPIVKDVHATVGGRVGFDVSTDGVLVYRSGVPAAPSELVWFDRSGKRIGTAGERGFYTNPALSPDGRYVAVGRSQGPSDPRDIWILDLLRGASSRLTFDDSDELNPAWSPDGSRVAFTSDRAGRRNIWSKSATGSGDAELVFDGEGEKSVEDWSPDGRVILFNVNSASLSSVAAGGEKTSTRVLGGTAFAQLQGRISPDGRWLAYTSFENDRRDVFVQTYPPGGGKWQISTNGGGDPEWRGDGRELFFVNNTSLYSVEVRTNGSRFEAGTPRELFKVADLHPEVRRNRYVVSGDGQRFLALTTPERTDLTPLTVVVNWTSLLPK
jgi:dipeptidyl aminopeptidase/acylaminoacyl peptidase